MALRLCVSVIALLAVTIFASYGPEVSDSAISLLYVVIAALFSINAISALWIHRRQSNELLYLSYSLLDVPITTGVIYLTGDSASLMTTADQDLTVTVLTVLLPPANGSSIPIRMFP